MVEDTRKRGRGQRGGNGHSTAVKGRQVHVAADHDAFVAFTSKYRDMLRFADADEAEAVYSMVSLTQAARNQLDWTQHNSPEGRGDSPEVIGEGRAAKRRQLPAPVPAASACSEGGRSDSSAKSAPGPPPVAQQWNCMLMQHSPNTAAPGYNPGNGKGSGQQQQAFQQQPIQGQQVGQYGAAGAAASGAVGTMNMGMYMDIHPGAMAPAMTPMGPMSAMNMNMGPVVPPPFFPPMPGMMGPPGAATAGPMMPVMPPCAMLPPGLMHPMLFGGMPLPPGMMGPGPAGTAPPMPFMPGVSAPFCPAGMSPAAEPAAGIPISGPMPPVLGACSGMVAGVPASTCARGSNTANGTATAGLKQGKGVPVASAAAGPRQISPGVPSASGAVVQTAGSTAAAAAATQPAVDLLQELDQLDVVALRPWVLLHFCEDVYLLLLDAWRPDSSKVKEAIWSWKLHIKGPRPVGAEPDYRAFLVSLFGLEKLLQLTAAAANRDTRCNGSSTNNKVKVAGTAGDCLPSSATAAAATPATPAAAAATLAAAAGADTEGPSSGEAAATNSNLSSDPGATLTAPGPHIMSLLTPANAMQQ